MTVPRAQELPLVSVVFVTYDRIQTLMPTVESFLSLTDYPRNKLELILADDGSPADARRAFDSLGMDRIVIGRTRSGIGANQNRGLVAATGDFIVQIQDDWLCQGPRDYLTRALSALRSRSEIGMVILNEHPNKVPIRAMASLGADAVRVYNNFPSKKITMVGQNGYTDWPHLKRREFHQAIGLYKEGVHMATGELDFSQRVNNQTRYFVADIVGLNVFRHIGAHLSYNTNTVPARIIKKLERLPGGAWPAQMLRRIPMFRRT